MSSYQQLAGAYDELTWDVGYEKRADFLEKLFRRSRIPVHTVLDLACGTGSMTWLLAGRGYELIAVDGSQELLAAARQEAEAAAARRVAKLEKALEQARGAAAAAEDRKETAEAALQDAERERDSALDAAKGYKAEAEAAHKLAAAASNEGMTKFKVVFDQTVENVNTLAALLQALPDSQQEKLRRALLALAGQERKVGA